MNGPLLDDIMPYQNCAVNFNCRDIFLQCNLFCNFSSITLRNCPLKLVFNVIPIETVGWISYAKAKWDVFTHHHRYIVIIDENESNESDAYFHCITASVCLAEEHESKMKTQVVFKKRAFFNRVFLATVYYLTDLIYLLPLLRHELMLSFRSASGAHMSESHDKNIFGFA